MDKDELRELMREVFKARQYIVIGQPPHATLPFAVGQIVWKLFQYEFGQPFEVFAATEKADWDKQSDLIAKLRPKLKRTPTEGDDGAYFRVRPTI